MRRRLAPALLLLIPCRAVAQAHPVETPASSTVVAGELGDSLDDYMSRLEVYGLSGALLVARDGEVVLRKGYGAANRQDGSPVRVTTPFLIGSLSKQFTAAAILKLAEQGRLEVEDPLREFFPDAPADKAAITLHQLLTHTAGLPYLPGELMEMVPRAAVMREMLHLPLQSEPGERYAYSNPGYTLLAGVIEKASGQSYETYLRENLFAPAGMENTGFMDEPRWDAATVHSYSGATDEGPLPEFPSMPKAVGAGTIVSTVDDLYRWEQALRSHTVLSEASTERFFAPHVATGQGPMRYAYGWNVVTTTRGTRLITHAGDLGGYNAGYRRYVDEDLVVIFLSNARADGPGYRDAVMNNLSLRIAGLPHLTPPAVARPTGDHAALTGDYRLPSGEALRVRAVPAGLRVVGDTQEEIALLAGADPATGAHAEQLNQRTDSVVRGLLAGDLGPARAHAHPSFPIEGSGAELRNRFREYEQRFGALEDVEILGTAVTSPATARTFVRLDYPRGEVVESFAWLGGKLAVINHDLGDAYAVLFAPTAAGDYRSFDMFTGTSVRMTPMPDEAGVADLRFAGPGGTATARLAPDQA